MISYRTVISCKFPVETILENGEKVVTNELKYFPIDLLNDRTVNANSHVATQPMQRGDYMADHMYRDPVNLTISGQFSMNGRNLNNKSYAFMSTNNRLSDIQKTFEYIKNHGILCNIMTIATDIDMADSADAGKYDANNTRFITRENMALEGINWTEKVNSLAFNFSFKEVITVDEIEYEVDSTDKYLPNPNLPTEAAFGTLLMDSQDLPKIVVRALYDKGLIKKKWAKWVVEDLNDNFSNYIEYDFKTLTYGALNAVIAATLAACIGLAIVGLKVAGAAIAGATASIVPVGTAIVAVAAVAAFFAAGIYSIIKRCKNKELAKYMFENGKEDLERLNDTCADVEKELNSAALYYKVIELQSNEDQQICLSIGGDYFYIQFTRCTESPYFTTQITSSNKRWTQTKVKNPGMPYITSFEELDESRVWFENNSNDKYKVFLVNVNVNDDLIDNNSEEKENVLKTLTTYQIWIVKNSVKEAKKQLENTITSAVLQSVKKYKKD